MVVMGLEEILTLYSVMEASRANQCLKVLLQSKTTTQVVKFQNRLFLNHQLNPLKEFIMLPMVQEETHISSTTMEVQILITKRVIALISKIIYSSVIKKEVLSTHLKWISYVIIKSQVGRLTTIGLPKKPLSLIVKYSKAKNALLISYRLEIKLLEIQSVCRLIGID